MRSPSSELQFGSEVLAAPNPDCNDSTGRRRLQRQWIHEASIGAGHETKDH